MELLLAMGVFGTAMLGMGVGVLLSNRSLRGSCGGPDVVTADGEALSCGACPKQEVDLCPSDDPLVRLAQVAHPNPHR
ncbi:MAG: hypothetical protein KTR31_03055 [Myxococcales bacterium]|nr:hypothetical protein [Myxococcales bacterium]